MHDFDQDKRILFDFLKHLIWFMYKEPDVLGLINKLSWIKTILNSFYTV